MLMCPLNRSATVNSFAAGSASRRPQFDDRPDFFRLGRFVCLLPSVLHWSRDHLCVFVCVCSPALPYTSSELAYNDGVEDKRGYYLNCSVLCMTVVHNDMHAHMSSS